MTKSKGTILLTAEVTGAQTAARGLEKMRRKIDPTLTREFRTQLQSEVVNAMQAVAPEDTGLLKELIEGKVSFGRARIRLTVESPVRDPATNYPYTGVTRFGHKKRKIFAKHAHGSTEFNPSRKTLAGDPTSKFFLNKGHAPALAVHAGGRYGEAKFRTAVRGYRPAGDWVERGMPAADEAVDRAAERVGRRIVSNVRGL